MGQRSRVQVLFISCRERVGYEGTKDLNLNSCRDRFLTYLSDYFIHVFISVDSPYQDGHVSSFLDKGLCMTQFKPKPSPTLFIPGTQILRPVIDVVSKRLLEHNKEALISLLTAVLSPDSPIADATILNSEMHNGPAYNDKLSRLDLLVRLYNGQLINIEFQTGNQIHFVRRALFYLFQMGVGALKGGEDYGRLPNLTGIYIFDDIFRSDVDDVHLVYEPTCVKPNDGSFLKRGLLRMDFIQLPKFSALNPSENKLLSAWVQLFGAKTVQDLDAAGRESPVLDSVVRSLKKMSSNHELIDLAEKRRLEKIIDRRARIGELEDAKEEARTIGLEEGRKVGLQEGRQEGRQEGQSEALRFAIQKILFKKLNLSPEVVAPQLTSLTVSQLEEFHEAALDFVSPSEVEQWLKQRS